MKPKEVVPFKAARVEVEEVEYIVLTSLRQAA
jgi:hypothetical protein